MNKHSLETEQIQMRRVVVFSNVRVKREKVCATRAELGES